MKRCAIGCVLVWLSATASAQQRGAPPPPATETTAPNIPGVVTGGTRVQVIKEGFQGTEGPIGLPDGSLIFTETNASRITKIDKDNNTSTYLENTNGSNGLAFDAKGRLISVQTTAGQTKIGVLAPKGSEAVLADSFEGKPFGRPNDLVVDKKGGVYFTEPGPNAAPGAPPPPLTPAVYYVPPGGRAMRIAEGIERPNGIMLSRDEKALFVNNTSGEYLLAFDIQPDGTVKNRRNFAKYQSVTKTDTGVASGADGLAIDNDGRLYVATAGGVECSAATGSTSARFRCRARRRTSRLPARTRRRSTSSGAAPPTKSSCSRRDTRAARSNAWHSVSS
jgi:gluconolactonase